MEWNEEISLDKSVKFGDENIKNSSSETSTETVIADHVKYLKEDFN